MNHNQQLFVILRQFGVVFAQFGDGFDAVHDRGVVPPAERIADGGQAEVGQLFSQTHGDLARAGDVAGAFFAKYVADFNPVVFRRCIDDDVGGNDLVFDGDDVL